MTKGKFTALILIVLFIILVFTVTTTYLVINKKDTGSSKVNQKYYDIQFTNVTIDYDTTAEVKISNDKDFIHIDIPNLNEFKRTCSISIDVKNIGNIDALVEKVTTSNIVTNVNASNVIINTTILKDDIIKGSEEKKLIIDITYIGKEKIVNPYYNFNINYSFDEVVL